MGARALPSYHSRTKFEGFRFGFAVSADLHGFPNELRVYEMATLSNIGSPAGRARGAVAGLLFAPFALLVSVSSAQTGQVQPDFEPMFDGPRLSIEVNEKDFGLVTRGEVIEASFDLKNLGSEPLKILRVKPG